MTIDHLLQNSGLPGPRGNLSLMYRFAASASAEEIASCLAYLTPDLHNSPEEFVAMCGIVAYCVAHQSTPATTLSAVRPQASHSSWRIREAVAMGIQEMAVGRMGEVLEALDSWVTGTDGERRAVVAGLAEPKLLKVPQQVVRILGIFDRISRPFETLGRLTDSQKTLRQALGYGWSVVVAALPSEGQSAFEALAESQNPHLRWIVNENLKKNRLHLMDAAWVDRTRFRVKNGG